MKRIEILLFAALAIPQRSPDIEIKGFNFVESIQNQKSLEIDALQAHHFKLESILQLSQPQARVWVPEKKNAYFFLGDEGIFSSQHQLLQVNGNARIQTPEGYFFFVPYFDFDNQKKSISTGELVELTDDPSKKSKKLNIKGRGLLIDIPKAFYEIQKDVEVYQSLTSGKKLNISSRSAQILPGSGLVSFKKNVRLKGDNIDLKGQEMSVVFATQGDQTGFNPKNLTLHGSEGRLGSKIEALINQMKIRSNGLHVAFNADGEVESSSALGAVDAVFSDDVKFKADSLKMLSENGERKIVLNGAASIITGNKTAIGEDAIYYPDSGEFVIEKGASVQTDSQTLRGDRIRFSAKNQDIIVEKASGSLKKNELIKKRP